MKSRSSKPLALTGLAVLLSGNALAAEFRSVDAPVAIFFDAPSQKGKKLFVVRRHTPVEVVVQLEGWTKVRDPEGTLAWIEKKALADKRTLVVVVPRTDVRAAADAGAALVFEAEKGVALDLVDPAKDGWVKVKHLDGQQGFIRATAVWGL